MKLILHLCTWFCHQQYFNNWLLFRLCPACLGSHPLMFWISTDRSATTSLQGPCSNIQPSSQWSLFPLYCKLISPLFTIYVCYFLCSHSWAAWLHLFYNLPRRSCGQEQDPSSTFSLVVWARVWQLPSLKSRAWMQVRPQSRPRLSAKTGGQTYFLGCILPTATRDQLGMLSPWA